ncbi:MAG: hypothetical protein ACK4YL_21285 [Microcystis sp.]|uniref:hypothetical protein n=1 Tax=Microcystis sp. TaxID=1127 RepID=UPI003918B8DD
MWHDYLGSAEKVFRGGRVWGFTHFQVVNYLIFREKVTEFFPDHSNGRHFLGGKKSKNLIQQGF